MTQDPLGLAGGVNLYAYASNNPVGFRDPFGLCASSASDSVQIKVSVQCPDGRVEKQLVWAKRGTDPETLAGVRRAAEKLKGGTVGYPADAVRGEYEDLLETGQIYALPDRTADGGRVIAMGASLPGKVFFLQSVLRQLAGGRLNRLEGGFRTPCNVLGHEGAHHVQFSRGTGVGNAFNEDDAQATEGSWRC